MVQHRHLNLLHDFSPLGIFDVVFCRNVLIYFDQDTKINIFNRLARTTEPDGILLPGSNFSKARDLCERRVEPATKVMVAPRL